MQTVSPLVCASDARCIAPIEGESLLAWSVRAAAKGGRERAWTWLRELGLDYHAKPGALLLGSVSPDRLAARLGADIGEVESRMLLPAAAADFSMLGGLLVRSIDVVTHTRRFSPATIKEKGTHLQLSMIRTLPFCPESGEYLVDRCGRCRRTQHWKSTINVLRCDHCGSGLWLWPAEKVEEDILPYLRQVADLISTVEHERLNALSMLSTELALSDGGSAFEMVVALAKVIDPRLQMREPASIQPDQQRQLARAMAGAWRIALGWPETLTGMLLRAELEPGALARLIHAGRTTTRRAALPAVASAFANLFVSDEQVLRVKPSARLLGITEGSLAESRQRGEFATGLSIRRGFPRLGLAREEIERLSTIRRDRIGEHTAAAMLSLPTYGVEQMVDMELLKVEDHPWLVGRFGRPVLTREAVASHVSHLQDSSVNASEEDVAISVVMRGFGGGPKPWGMIHAMLKDGTIAFSMRTTSDGRLVISVRKSAAARLLALEPGRGRPDYSQEEALEILNLSPKHAARLAGLPKKPGAGNSWSLCGTSVEKMARELMSPGEAAARFGKVHKTTDFALKERGCFLRQRFWWCRKEIAHQAGDLLS